MVCGYACVAVCCSMLQCDAVCCSVHHVYHTLGFVFAYGYIYICTHIYTLVYIYVCIYIYIRVSGECGTHDARCRRVDTAVRVLQCVCVRPTSTYIHTHSCVQKYMNICIGVGTNICTHVYIYMYIYVYTYTHTYLCSYKYEGLIDWFEVDLGFTELFFIQIDLYIMCCFVLYSLVSTSSCPFLDILHCLPRAVGVPLESALNLVSRISPCGP